MSRKFSDALQDSYVTQGLALGVLSHGVEWIPSDKLAFEFALSHAWRSFPSATQFYRVMSNHRADPYYLLPVATPPRTAPGRLGGRRSRVAALRVERRLDHRRKRADAQRLVRNPMGPVAPLG